MVDFNDIIIRKINSLNIEDTFRFVEKYNELNPTSPCEYTIDTLSYLVPDENTLVYGTYLRDELIAISGVTLILDNCLDFLETAGLSEYHNLCFTPFAILPDYLGQDIMKYSTNKLLDYLKQMDCDNVLAVCGLDDIISIGVAKSLGMKMVENYDNNNRKIFLLKLK